MSDEMVTLSSSPVPSATEVAARWFVPADDEPVGLPAPTMVKAVEGLLAADAETILARAIGATVVQLNRKALVEAAYLIIATGDWGRDVVQFAMRLKEHQSPFALGQLMKALEALSLKKFMSKVQVNLGGK